MQGAGECQRKAEENEIKLSRTVCKQRGAEGLRKRTVRMVVPRGEKIRELTLGEALPYF